MKINKAFFAGIIFASFLAAPVLSVFQPAPVASAACSEARLLGIPPWYRGLTKEGPDDDCVIIGPSESSIPGDTTQEKLTNYFTRLTLNILEMVTVIIGYIAVFFILYGGFMFIINNGNSATIEKARHSILNAIIGLAIALGAIAIINLMFGLLV